MKTVSTRARSVPILGASRQGSTAFLGESSRGSVLVVALLIAALIALALGSYLNLNLTSARLAQRSFHQHAAFNLAEAGAEEALWSFNQAALSSNGAWDEWTRDGNAAWRKINNFDFGANATGSVKVYVDNAAPPPGTRPKIVSLSSVESPGQSPVTKMIEITLARRSPFANGLTARDSITFSGSKISVDSWNSDPDNDPATPSTPYSLPVRNDRGTVASMSILNTAALVNQATVWGFVTTGEHPPEVGGKGLIGPFGTPEGTIHPSRVSTDFNANFPDVVAPSGTTFLSSIGDTLGTLGTATSWSSPQLNLSGNDTLTIQGDVTLVLTSAQPAPFTISGNAALIIPEGSSLSVYVEGDILISGNGVINANAAPASFQLWGTNTTTQTLDVVGNGTLSAVVNAPNATVSIKGNATLLGAVIADRIVLAGNIDFHYDEALADFGTDQPFGTSHWRSLKSEELRQEYKKAFARF